MSDSPAATDAAKVDVQVTDSGPVTKTLNVTIPAATVSAAIDGMYASAAQQVQMKGFRPGKVPRKMLETRLGKNIMNETKENLIKHGFQHAIQEQKISPVGTPRVDNISEGDLDAKKAFTFDVVCDIKPEFELQTVKGLKVQAESTEPTDEDVDRALEQVVDQKKELGPIDEAAQEGDFVETDMTFFNEAGEQIHERTAVRLSTAIPLAGADPEAFTKALLGAEKDGEFTMDLTFPESFEKADVRGQKGTVQIRVGSVLRIQAPPIDDDLAKSFEIESLDKLKSDLKERIGDEKIRVEAARQEQELFNQLIEAHPIELPPSLVEQQKRHGLEAFEGRMKEAGLGEEEIKAKIGESEEEATQDARKRVHLFFIIDAIARQEELAVTDADLQGELAKIAAANQTTVEEVHKFFETNQRFGDLRLGLMERKVRDFLREHAEIADSE